MCIRHRTKTSRRSPSPCRRRGPAKGRPTRAEPRACTSRSRARRAGPRHELALGRLPDHDGGRHALVRVGVGVVPGRADGERGAHVVAEHRRPQPDGILAGLEARGEELLRAGPLGLADLPPNRSVGALRLDVGELRIHANSILTRFGRIPRGNVQRMDGDTDFRFSPRPNRAHEIDWRPWGEPAFAEAHKLGRPILLSLSAVWCHWCHVMDETSYSDPRVIAALNEHFVPIRVDTDRHPDVSRRYNMGGWPTTAFLAASGDPITGATYMPPEQLLQALRRVREFFDANRTALLALGATEHAHAVDTEAALAHLGGAPRLGQLSAPDFDGDPDVPGDIPAEIALQIVRAFDPMHGGLGADPKFPQPDVFAFVLAYAELRAGGDPLRVAPHTSALLTPARVHEVVRTTLERMAGGGLYDHVAGGFFRYATQRDWSVPHYEKMLEDNARLAGLYLE